jgi:hypothetical protein
MSAKRITKPHHTEEATKRDLAAEARQRARDRAGDDDYPRKSGPSGRAGGSR